jgi:hypothetical protein
LKTSVVNFEKYLKQRDKSPKDKVAGSKKGLALTGFLPAQNELVLKKYYCSKKSILNNI